MLLTILSSVSDYWWLLTAEPNSWWPQNHRFTIWQVHKTVYITT